MLESRNVKSNGRAARKASYCSKWIVVVQPFKGLLSQIDTYKMDPNTVPNSVILRRVFQGNNVKEEKNPRCAKLLIEGVYNNNNN